MSLAVISRKILALLMVWNLLLWVSSWSQAQPIERHIYKKTPQGDLSIQIHYPKQWKTHDQRPAMVFFFGGGWTGGSIQQFEPQAAYFASRGMVTARADYRVNRRHGTSPEQCVEDGKSAVRWLRQNAALLGIDPNRIVAAGGSAGGHVAACTWLSDGFEADDEEHAISSQPDALLLFNPVLNLMEFDLEQRAESVESAKSISPLHLVEKKLPPTLMFYGTQDKFIKQGQDFAAKAQTLGSSIDIFIAQNADHGFFNQPPWLQETMIAADRFLAKLGFLTGEPTLSVAPKPTPTPSLRTTNTAANTTSNASRDSNDSQPLTGRFKVSFTEHHPLAKDTELSQRYGLRLGSGAHSGYFYDIQKESFEAYVPPHYDGSQPFGLFVWISASPSGDIPDRYIPLMDKYNIIWVGANQSGNSENVYKRRVPLALDAAYNIQKHYRIDPNRTYISGVSGGGRVSSSTAMHHSDVYAGGLFIIGANYWERMESPSERNRYWPAGFPKPKPVYFRKARREGRYVLLTGENDFNREQMKLYYEKGYQRHLNHVLYLEVPEMGHVIPNADGFEKALLFLDNPNSFR